MPSLDPKAGNRCLTVTGAPVQVLEVHDGTLLLQSLASDNRLCVPSGYPLRPFDQKKVVWELRPSPYSPRSQVRKGMGALARSKPLAPILDALLMEGGRSMKGIVREVKRRASGACKGKDVAANERARIYWLRNQAKRKFSS